ncbi:winged helix-turn-helix domain-containing protein [Nonomuraea sp. NPDC049625]|uniref:winged helix-turn-helix domain-containing protein n=1 Tax=Nonomuraea sp. NPDC049625 TaxID=3155775 RepID=UPI0034477F16
MANDFRQRIATRKYPPGAMIPSEATLMAEFGVPRGTVRQALAELERDGLVVSQMGRGRRVQGEATPVDRGRGVCTGCGCLWLRYRRVAWPSHDAPHSRGSHDHVAHAKRGPQSRHPLPIRPPHGIAAA